ncbi:hypothetical protein HNE_3043 [Hyphomonas neptunium ATCC 15444]|uniref:Uncharacterized protein n=2 Tax=Hyphomonas TaxID=85 RepID=Q0BXS3_HYPNA|nr:hypothetical protein HNE_3043 [Hyphomonas neptunium ATCC 15444]KCZ93590.1 hypothetical protein HHI_09347 [Hyphomonas hirschiana VP5]
MKLRMPVTVTQKAHQVPYIAILKSLGDSLSILPKQFIDDKLNPGFFVAAPFSMYGWMRRARFGLLSNMLHKCLVPFVR